MGIDDIIVSKIIFNRFSREFNDCFDVDVAIAGGGPAGLIAGKYLSKAYNIDNIVNTLNVGFNRGK